MLNDNPMIEGTTGEVHITDFKADVIENLLSFMYNDIVDKKNINCDLLKAANKYLMEGLKNVCSQYLSGTSMSFYPNFIQVLSKLYPHFIHIKLMQKSGSNNFFKQSG